MQWIQAYIIGFEKLILKRKHRYFTLKDLSPGFACFGNKRFGLYAQAGYTNWPYFGFYCLPNSWVLILNSFKPIVSSSFFDFIRIFFQFVVVVGGSAKKLRPADCTASYLQILFGRFFSLDLEDFRHRFFAEFILSFRNHF